MGQKTHPIGFRLGKRATWQDDLSPNCGSFQIKSLNVRKYIDDFFQSRDILVNKVQVVGHFVPEVHVDFYSQTSTLDSKDLDIAKKVINLILGCDKTRFYFIDLAKLFNDDPVKNKLSGGTQKGVNEQISVLAGYLPIAHILVSQIVKDLEKSPRHLRVVEEYNVFIRHTFDLWSESDSSYIIDNGLKLKLKGCLIQVKGRLSGSDRSRRSVVSFGQVPLTTLNTLIDYHYEKAITPYGVLGVKIWLAYEHL